MSDPVTVRGIVSRELYAAGSKSEHWAPILTTDEGARYLLRRAGGSAYADPDLDELAGQAIEATGLVHRDILLLTEHHPL